MKTTATSHETTSASPTAGRRQEFAGLLGEVQQNRVAVEDRDAVVDDRGYFGVGVDGEIRGAELLATARVDRNRLIGKPHLLQCERDLGWVGRAVEVEFDHERSPWGELSATPSFITFEGPAEGGAVLAIRDDRLVFGRGRRGS